MALPQSGNIIHHFQPSGLVVAGGKVTDWTDDGSVGVDLTNPNTSTQPIHVSSEPLINNEAGAEWDTNGQYLQHPSDPNTGYAGGLTFAFVCKWTDTASSYRFLLAQSSGYAWHGGASTNLFLSAASANIKNGSVWIDGISVAPLSAQKWSEYSIVVIQPTAATGFGRIGYDRADTTRTFRGIMAEIVVWDATLDPADRALAIAHLSGKYFDTTPPAIPSGREFAEVEATGTPSYGLTWGEPADSDFDYIQIRRDIDGTPEYLNASGGLPAWEGSEGTPLKFATDGTHDIPLSSFVDQDVTFSSTIAYYARSVDESINGSAWSEFTIYTSGSSDFPDESDVKAGVEYDEGNLTGTYGIFPATGNHLPDLLDALATIVTDLAIDDYDATPIPAAKAYSPSIKDQDAPKIYVIPQPADIEAEANSVNRLEYNIALLITADIDHDDEVAQVEIMLGVKRQLMNQINTNVFVGSKAFYCQEITETDIFDHEKLTKDHRFHSAVIGKWVSNE